MCLQHPGLVWVMLDWWILHWDTEGIEPTQEQAPVSYGLVMGTFGTNCIYTVGRVVKVRDRMRPELVSQCKIHHRSRQSQNRDCFLRWKSNDVCGISEWHLGKYQVQPVFLVQWKNPPQQSLANQRFSNIGMSLFEKKKVKSNAPCWNLFANLHEIWTSLIHFMRILITGCAWYFATLLLPNLLPPKSFDFWPPKTVLRLASGVTLWIVQDLPSPRAREWLGTSFWDSGLSHMTHLSRFLGWNDAIVRNNSSICTSPSEFALIHQ